MAGSASTARTRWSKVSTVSEDLSKHLCVRSRTALENFDSGIATVEYLVSTLQKLAKAQIVNLRQKRNELCPISRLPVELLVSVFNKYIKMEDEHEDADVGAISVEQPEWFRKMSTISLVSRRWNGVLRGAPQFWSRINILYAPSFIRKALERSQTHPLDIRGNLAAKPGDVLQQEAIVSVFSHVSRWSIATLKGHTAADFDLLTYPPAPRLKALDLACNPAFHTPLDLLDGTAPILEHLALEGVPVRWTSPILSGLLSLTLRNIDGPDPTQLLDILHACPNLHTLRLTTFRCGTPSQPTGDDQPVELPKLTTLSVQTSAQAMQDIFGRIRCPSVSDVWISLPPTIPHDALQTIIQFVLAFLRRVVSDNEGLNLKVWDKRIAFCRKVGATWNEFQFAFKSNSAAMTVIMEELRRTFSFPFIHLSIYGSISATEWPKLNKFPTARGCQVERAPGVLSFLGDAIETNGELHWNLPHLKILWIGKKCCMSGEEIFKMVQGRKGRLHPDTATPKQLPSAFETLVITTECPMDRVTYMKLKTILPSTKVIWEGN